MSSTFITEGDSDTSSANDTVIIIVNNESGSISMDEETLQKLLVSGTENVSVVQLAEDNHPVSNEDVHDPSQPQVNLTLEGFYTPGMDHQTPIEHLEPQPSSVDTMDPFLNIDQEEIEKIAHALQSDQASQILAGSLSEMLDTDSQSEVLGLLDAHCVPVHDPHAELVTAINLEHSYSLVPPERAHLMYSMMPKTRLSDYSDIDEGRTPSPALSHHNTVVENASQRPPSPKRRSQRQIERSEKEQLEKIRAENEEMLKKEKEVMKKKLHDDWQLDQFAETSDMKDDTLPSPDELSDALASDSPVLEDLKRPPPTRMAEIRQAMQEQILAIDPLGKKVLPTTPKVSPSPVKTQPERQNRQENSVVSTSLVTTPTTSSVATPTDVSGRKSYPKRENRKPPPHLRDVLFGPSLFSAPDVMKVVGGGPTSPEKKPKADNAKKVVANPEVMAALAETAAIFEGSAGGEGGKKGAKGGKAKAELIEKPRIEEEEQEEDEEESGSEQSWNSEDDPDRLWCICRKPHNNRFMICCDKCEDWFHGKCVGLTRQMGKAMEEKGIEWVCPKCKAQATAKVNERKNSHVSLPDPDPESATEEESMTMKCIISGCSKEARPNSIYCSDQCIMQHAKESLALYSKDKEQTVVKEEKKEAQAAGTAVAPADTKKPAPEPLKAQTFYSKGATTPTTPSVVGTATTKASPQGNNLQVTRKIIVLQELPSGKSKGAAGAALEDMAVMVYERKSGKILQGNLAPKLSNLETWLKQHPTFEVLKPGMIPKAKEKVEKPVAPTPQRKRKEPPKPAVPEKKEKKPSGPEVMRTSVKTSLKDALFGRAKDAADITMNEADITELADKIEEELYAYFGDVNLKYKSKYRSLTFNIRDTKNEGLFRKILKGEMKPKQLVRMSPEDLASQELAQWRERENKHQLEIIQKTELESLSMANKYILKTHKGEEVIEADDALKTLDSAQKDVTGLPGLEDTTSQHKSHVFDLNCQICSGKIKESDYFPKPDGKEKDSKESKEKDRHSKSKDSKDTKDRHRHRDHHRRRSSSSSSHSHSAKKEHRDKDRDKDKERKSSSSSSKDSKDKSKDKDRSHSRHKDRHKDKERERKDSSGSSKEKRSDKSKTTPSGSDKSKSGVPEQAPPPLEAPKEEKHALEQNTEPLTQIKAVEQKPTSVSAKKEPQEDDKVENSEVVSEKTEIKEEKPESKPVIAPEVTKEQETKAVTAIQEEPTSTVIISTPEQRSPVVGSPRVGLASAAWKGNIVSSESGKFHVLGYEVSGIVDKLPAELPDSLDVVGRIKPAMAWDYIKQTKRVGTRDIVILKFLPTTDMDKKNFSAFNYYLTKCDRLGVIGNLPKTIKDFYIFPLAPSDPIPPALLPFEGPGLDSERPVMLLGVVIRAKRMKRSLERPSTRFKSKEERVEAIRAAKMAKITDEPYDPSSPTINLSPMYKPSKRKPETVELPSSKAPKRDDDDEPYSPGQPLDEESAETVTNTIPAVTEGPETKDVGSSKALSDQVSILEELTRKIEENKRQIRSMSSALLPTDNTSVFTGLAASTVPSTSLITQTISTIPGLGDAPSVPIPGLGDNTEEPYSPSNQRYTPSPPPPTPPVTSVAAVVTSALPVLASKIAIPSNLQEILSTIQKKEQEQKRTILKSDPIVMNYAGTRTELSDPVCGVETLAAKDVDMRVLPPTPNMAQGPIMATVPHLSSPAQLQAPATILSIRSDIPPHLASQMPPATNLPLGTTIPLGSSVSVPLGSTGAPTDPRMRPAPPPVASSSAPLDNKGLRALSDAELLAKALEMEQELTGASPAPNQKKKKGKGGKDKQKQQQQPRRDRYNSRSSSDYSPPRRGRDRDWDRDYDKERGRGRNNRWESDREINNRDNRRNAGWRQNAGPSPQYNAPVLNMNTVPRQQQPMVPVMTSPRAQIQQHMNVPPIALGQPPPVVQAPPVAPILHTEAPRPVVLTNPSNSVCNVTPAPQGAISQSVPKETAPVVPPMGRFVPAKSVASNEEEEEEEPPPPGE